MSLALSVSSRSNIFSMKFTVLLVVFCLLPTFYVQVNCANYCSKSLCPPGKRHIACGNKYKRFVPSCPSNARMINLKKYSKMIVNEHNRKRNLVASGRLKGYKPARRMATMQWDNQLAYLASLNVKQCKVKHDSCRNTPKFPLSGQNLGMVGYKDALAVRKMIKSMLGAFFQEYKNANMKIINSYPASHSGPEIGHFTAMVAERNNRIGCGASTWNDGSSNYFLIACNYAATNVVGKSIYRKGKTALSCKTGRNPVFKSLCNPKEKYPKYY